MVRCIVAGLERGEGFAQLWNFSNFLGKTRPYARQPKNKAAKTPHREKSNKFSMHQIFDQEPCQLSGTDRTRGSINFLEIHYSACDSPAD
jgi:hypothetical protein